MSGNLIISTRSYTAAAKKIQAWFHRIKPLLAFRHRGPAANDSTLAHNETEVYSMDPISKIPPIFFFSYADSKKVIWAFDIRSLSAILSQGQHPSNPYTREPFSPSTLQKLRQRIMYLRRRKYPLVYVVGESLTEEQAWNQKVLDAFMKLESLGYLSSCSWFHAMTLDAHKKFYRKMYQLWNWRLGLSQQDKEGIVPHSMRNSSKLFKWVPDNVCSANHDLTWWQKSNLSLILNFISRSEDKTKQGLGALYCLMGLVQVSEMAAEAYPWILESVE
jgi:hypothetical protein